MTVAHPLDIELVIERSDQGSAFATLRVHLSSHHADLIERTPLRLDEQALLKASADPRAYAEALTDMVFTAPLREAWSEAMGYTKGSNQQPYARVRLTLKGTDTLHTVRWELLRDPITQTWLAHNEPMAFSRHLGTRYTGAFQIMAKPQLHALIAVSGAREPSMAEVHIADEVQCASAGFAGIKQTILDGKQGPSASLEHIKAALRTEPTVLYLACHGIFKQSEPYLYLDGDSPYRPTSGRIFVEQLQNLAYRPRLIILASCRGAGDMYATLAALGPQLIHIGVGAVIAMAGDVSMDFIQRLMPPLLRELDRDGRIDRALAAARAEFHPENDPWWQPVLWMTVRDGALWQDQAPIPARNGQQPAHDAVMAFVDYFMQLPTLLPESAEAISKLERLVEALNLLSDEVWADEVVQQSLITAFTKVLSFYDEQVERVGDIDPHNPALQPAYIYLELIEQCSIALRLGQRIPSIAGAIVRRLARRNMRVGDYQHAEEQFAEAKRLLGTTPSSETAYVCLDQALLCFHDSSYEQAYALVEAAVELATQVGIAQRGEFYYLLGLAAFETNRPERQRHALRKAREQFKVARNQRRLHDLATSEVLMAYYSGHAIQALELIQELLDAGERNVDLLHYQAMADIDCQRPEAALQSIEQALRLCKDEHYSTEEYAIMRCKLRTAKLDAHRVQIRLLASYDIQAARTLYDDTFVPAYRSLKGYMRHIGTHEGIENERIDMEVFYGEASLSVGALKSAEKALVQALAYVDQCEESDIFSSRIQQQLLATRVLAVQHRYDEAIARCASTCERISTRLSAHLLLIPAHLRLAEIATAAGEQQLAQQALDDAHEYIQEGISPHRMQEVQAMQERIRSAMH